MRVFYLVVVLLTGTVFAQSAERVEVVSRDQTYPAYLTVPEDDGQKPAVVLLHSIRGQQPGYETVADQLAAGADSVILHGATPTELAPVVQAWGRVRELDRFADLPANPGWMRG